jgi:signal transduction histidine kinase
MLDDMGLGAAINWLLTEFEKRSGIKKHFRETDKETDIPETVKTGLFRIVQESLTNIARYAKAENVTVDLYETGGQLHLSIEDDGIGFDQQQTTGKKTLGILGIKERTFMMGGEFNIHSSPGKGTVIDITIPLNK